MMAEPEMGKQIIAYLGELSTPFGTTIEYRDGVGLVKISGG
jgi:hypothetical protein